MTSLGNSPLEKSPPENRMIKMKLLGMNGNKSPGPDSIDPFMIKCLAEPLSIPFSILFNKCINK